MVAVKPVLIDFGFFKIYSYGLFVSLGIIVAFLLALRRARNLGISEDDFYNLGFLLLLSGVFGARISYVLANLNFYRSRPLSAFYIWEGGLTSYGAIIGGLVAVVSFAKLKKIDFFNLADSIAQGLPAGFAIGRIGCFMNGCCYGIPAETPFSVVFPAIRDARPHLATQLFESAYSLLILLVLFYLDRNFEKKGLLFFSFLGLYGLFRFLNEFLRVNPKVLFGLSGSQVVSLTFIAVSLGFFVANAGKIKRKR